MAYQFTTPFAQYETFEELLQDSRRFEEVIGYSFLDLIFGATEATCEEPVWVRDWAVRLDEGDCRAMSGRLPEDVEAAEQDLLETEYDIPSRPGTCGTRRPQALRQARARRSAFLRRF